MKSACQLALMILFAGAGLRLIQAEEPLPQTDAASNGRRESAAGPAMGMKSITLRGVCVDEKDQPVAKARVRVFRYPSRLDAPLVVADQPADQDGRFLFDDVPTAVDRADFEGTGDVCIAATADGFASAIRFMDDKTLLTSLLPIDPFAPPSEHDVVEIALRLSSQAGTLSGTVRDESGKPLAGVTVSLPTGFQQALPGVQSAVTDAAGRYAITDLKRWTAGPVAHDVLNGRLEEVAVSCTFLLDHPDYARTQASSSAVPQSVDVVLHPPAIIDGTVYDEVTKRPAANVVVSAQGVARSGWYQTRTDGQGHYRLRMTKDHYNIWADADDRIAIAAKAVRADPGTTVEIAPIPLLRGGFVTGRVLDPRTNQPVRPTDDEPLSVAHYGPARPRTGAAVTSADVNAAGVFRLRVAPGKNFLYVMNGGFAAQVISIEDGQELRLDLGAAGSGADTDFAADLRLAADLRKQAQLEDTARKLTPRVRNVPQRQPPRSRRGDGPAARLLDRLEAQNAGEELFKDAWLRTLKEIVELGPAAVPELIAELDATEDDMMLRSLGFTLRAIGDPRAAPALIRALSKTLRPPGSDMGLESHDAELLKFAQQHDLNAQNHDDRYGFGRPVREICGALRELTGEKHGEEDLFGVFLEGLLSQQKMKRVLYQRVAQAWADSWDRNAAKHVKEAAYMRVNLPPLVAFAAEPPLPGMHFKIGGGMSNAVLESVFNPESKVVFYDLDTGRNTGLPDRWRDAKNIEGQMAEITAWARKEGFDLMGTEMVPPDGGKRVFAVQSLGLRAWELGAQRWKMESKDITLEELREEGAPAGELLLHRDPQSGQIDPRAIASFLYITQEGTPGLLFVGVEVQDDRLQPGGVAQGDNELRPIAFRKGRRFALKGFTELDAEPGTPGP